MTVKKKRQRMFVVFEQNIDSDGPEMSEACPKGVFAKRTDANKFLKKLEKAMVAQLMEDGYEEEEAEEYMRGNLDTGGFTSYYVMPVPLEPEEVRP